MNKFSLSQFIIIFVVLVLGFTYALPNVYPTQPSIQVAYTDSGKSADQILLNQLEDTLTETNSDFDNLFLRDNKIVIQFSTLDQQLNAKTILQNKFLDKVIIALNLEPTTPDWLKSLGGRPVKLGLDLSGGVHFLLEVDIDTAEQGRLELLLDTYRKTFKEDRIKVTDSSIKDLALHFEFKDRDSYNKAIKIGSLSKMISDYLNTDLSTLKLDGTEDINIYFLGDIIRQSSFLAPYIKTVSYTHLTLPTIYSV